MTELATIEQIQAECKIRFPIGCKFKNAQGEWVLVDDDCVYKIKNNGLNIWACDGAGCLYLDGRWATLIAYPEGYVAPEKQVNNNYEIY